ncbi:hypothetical protein [Micromonospora parathelypteridis]|uniref:Uncharacterized protein n=1 Tax=Micromonospora parathelypteridis TaxID=1839617 RepID=A0A840VSK5_9ACTN|nr:hypothetical protein [Micromonospora parathelypteridis]MBB5476008.1 hypothetical protein [Micromonospora parathelypteridis]GGO32393.1 hypothetical protein GCM10011576_62670 [Micromonospora parathelypteridis]
MAVLPLAAIAVTAAALALPAPAAAHPFGDPQTVSVARDDQRPEVVRVRWRVGGPDDLTLLGVSLGLLPSDRILLDGAVDYRATDPAVLASSEQFSAYLLKQITVADGERRCLGAVTEPPKALARAGVTVDYTCPGPVGTVTVVVRMLTDLNPAYRSMATGPDGQRAVYGPGEDSHDWTLAGVPAAGSSTSTSTSTSPGPGRSAVVQVAALVGGALLVAIGALLVSRRLRRRRAVA